MPQSSAVRFRCTVEYDGARFCGYQVQPALRTVQGTIEQRLGRLFDRPVRVIAAGRTDTGVHAVGQEIVFDAPAAWSPARIEQALCAVLPADITVRGVRRADPDFHPRFGATGRRYEYYLGEGSPLRAARVWRPPSTPDESKLHAASALLPGLRSFAALSRSGQPELGSDCTVERAEWSRTPLGDLRFVIVADRFLHRMVRYIVATLVDVGRGRRDPSEWESLLLRGTGRPPEPAPAAALYLTGVRYHEGWNRPPGVPGLWSVEPVESTERQSAFAGVSAGIEIE